MTEYYAYHEEPKRSATPWLVGVIVALLVALALVAAFALGLFSPATKELSEPTTTAATAQPAPFKSSEAPSPTTVTTTPLRSYTNYAPDTDVTSAAFAAEVFKVFTEASQREGRSDVTITAYSPVTGQSYKMTCSGTDTVYCTGGNNARVKIW